MVAKRRRAEAGDRFEQSYGRLVRNMFEPRWPARGLAWLRPGRLDLELIAGADPACSAQLAARAATLTHRCSRAELADALERVLHAAQRPRSRQYASPAQRPVLDNAAVVRDLAQMLRGARPLYASGIALLSRLLTDGTGPVYAGDGPALSLALLDARAAMFADEPVPTSASRPGRADARPRRVERSRDRAWRCAP